MAKISKRVKVGVDLPIVPFIEDDEQNPEVKVDFIPKSQGFRFEYSNEPNEEEFLHHIKSFLESYGFDKDSYADKDEKSIEINELLKFSPDQKIKFAKYLGFNSRGRKKLQNILTADGDKLLIAPMGAGKTQGIVDVANEINHKVLYAVPLVFNVEQFSEKYKFADKIDKDTKLSAGKNKLANKNVVFCTYDTANRIIDTMLGKDIKDYTLVIDEAHNLVCQSLFRDQALRKLREQRKKFNKVIYITGTPEVLIPVLKKESPKIKIIEFAKRKSRYNKGSYNLIALSKCNPHRYLLEQLYNQRIEGITVIVEERINNLEVLRDLIVGYELATEDEIYFLSRNEKESIAYESLVKYETLPDNAKFLLSTSVISDGANLNDKRIRAFYSINWDDLTKLRQMQSRLREANKQLKYYDIIYWDGLINNENRLRVKDIYHHFALACRQREFTSKFYSMILSSDIKFKKFDSLNNDKSIYSFNNKFLTDDYAVLQRLLEKELYAELKSYPDKRLAYVESFFNFDPALISFKQTEYDFVEDDYDLYKTKIKERAKVKLEAILNFISENHNKVFRHLDRFENTRSKSNKESLVREDDIYRLLDDDLCRKVVKENKDLMDVGYPESLCIKRFSADQDSFISLIKVKNVFKQNKYQKELAASDYKTTSALTEQLIVIKLYWDSINNRQNNYPDNEKRIIVEAIKNNLRKNKDKVIQKEIKQELEATLGDKLPIIKYLNYIFATELGKGHNSYSHQKGEALKINEILGNINVQLTDEELYSLEQLGLPVN